MQFIKYASIITCSIRFITKLQEQVIEFLTDIFSFQKTDYTSVENLTKDLIKHTSMRIDGITNRLQKKLLSPEG